MVTSKIRWWRVLWPLALLLVFVAAFRRSPADAGDSTAAARCDPAPIGDVMRLEHCLDLDPRNVELLTELAAAERSSGHEGRAEAMYRRALTVDPHDGDLHVRLGELLLNRGDSDAARREAETALRWYPGNLAATHLLAAASAREVGR